MIDGFNPTIHADYHEDSVLYRYQCIVCYEMPKTNGVYGCGIGEVVELLQICHGISEVGWVKLSQFTGGGRPGVWNGSDSLTK